MLPTAGFGIIDFNCLKTKQLFEYFSDDIS